MTTALVEAIHASPLRLSMCVAGAGASAITQLTDIAGCSHTLLSADVLYSYQSTCFALDHIPPHLVSVQTARQLAQHAFNVSLRQLSLRSLPSGRAARVITSPVIGVGATSAIQTTSLRRGKDQVYVSVWLGHTTGNSGAGSDTASSAAAAAGDASPAGGAVRDYHMVLPKDWSRLRQDREIASLILHAIHEAVGWACPAYTPTQTPPKATDNPAATPAMTSEASALTAEVPCKPSLPFSVNHTLLPMNSDLVQIQHVLEGKLPVAVWNRHGELRCEAEPYGFEWLPGGQPQSPNTLEAVTATGTEQSLTVRNVVEPVRLIYPGSFRPLHWGHTELARAAVKTVLALRANQQQEMRHNANTATDAGNSTPPTATTSADPAATQEDLDISTAPVEDCLHAQVTYEISASIVDKGMVAAPDLRQRVEQFWQRGERIAVTTARLFTEKAVLFPHHGFVIGLDTVKRVLDPQYYAGGDEAGMVQALLTNIGDRGCYFVVGGRLASANKPDARSHPAAAEDDEWEELSSLNVPDAVKHLFIQVPESVFRVDVSSSELRARLPKA